MLPLFTMIEILLNSHFYFYYGDDKTSGVTWDTFIAFSGVIIAVFAIWVSARFQILSFVDAQLIEIAKTCNSYLQSDYQLHASVVLKESDKEYHAHGIQRGRASGIVTAFEDCEKIIESYYNKSRLLIFKSDMDNFKRVFYNHLHSSIKVLLKSVLISNEPGFIYVPATQDLYDPIRKDQLDKACEFFKKEIKETWEFEKDREKRLGIT